MNSSINQRLWRHWVVVEFHTAVSINFVLKLHWILNCFQVIVVEQSDWSKERILKKWHFRYHILLRLAVFRIAIGQLYVSCWSQRYLKRKPGRLILKKNPPEVGAPQRRMGLHYKCYGQHLPLRGQTLPDCSRLARSQDSQHDQAWFGTRVD